MCLSFVVASVGLLPACGTGKPSAPPSSTSSSSSAASPNPSASPSSSEDSGIIRAYGTAPVDPLTPGKAQDNASGRLVDLIFAGLVAWDSNGDTHYAAASDIEPNDDFTQFQVTVRSDLGFSDGTEVTAQSFIKAWDYVANIRHKQPNAPYLALIKGYGDLRRKDVTENAHMEGLTQTGEYSFTIELSQPCLNFMSLLANRAFDPLPEAFYANPSKFEANPIGNGP
ncbi:MAG: ABC transporter substrate-binding protein, partial [Parascardovia denticolens]